MEEWAQRAEGSGGVGNLARKVVKPASAGRKLTIKPFKGASARASVVVPVGQIARRARRARLSLPPSRRHRPAVGLPAPSSPPFPRARRRRRETQAPGGLRGQGVGRAQRRDRRDTRQGASSEHHHTYLHWSPYDRVREVDADP